jgi:hypothetical protein
MVQQLNLGFGQSDPRWRVGSGAVEHSHLTMQKTEIRFVRRSAVLNFDSSALQPDLRILWNTSIFHRKAYYSNFSMAFLREFTGRSVKSFQSIFFLFFGSPRS